MGKGGSTKRLRVRNPLRRNSEQSLGEGLNRPLQSKVEGIGLEMSGYQMKEGQGKQQ